MAVIEALRADCQSHLCLRRQDGAPVIRFQVWRVVPDFMFQLTGQEGDRSRSHLATASRRNFGAPPYAFTEQGVAMLSSVLRSPRANRKRGEK